MKNLQKLGGVSALLEGVAYIAGMVFFLLIVDYPGIEDPVQKVALLVENQGIMSAMHLFIYVAFGIFLVFLSVALHERLKADSPAMMQIATAFGLIWAGLLIASGMVFNVGLDAVADLYGTDPAQAASVWLAIDSVHAGLSGEGEILGGLWILLVSWAALRAVRLLRVLNYLGVVIGVAGILSIVPGLNMLVGVFAIGQIVWFIWLGILLLRRSSRATT